VPKLALERGTTVQAVGFVPMIAKEAPKGVRRHLRETARVRVAVDHLPEARVGHIEQRPGLPVHATQVALEQQAGRRVEDHNPAPVTFPVPIPFDQPKIGPTGMIFANGSVETRNAMIAVSRKRNSPAGTDRSSSMSATEGKYVSGSTRSTWGHHELK
jgi:hypothetical protein